MSTPYYPTDLRPRPADPGVNTASPPPGPRPDQNPFQVPPGTATDAAKGTAPAEPTTIDRLAEDANLPDYPDGAPELLPYLKLPFYKRAEAMRMLAALREAYKNAKMPEKDTEVGPEHAAEWFEFLGKMDDFLRFVAVDVDAYNKWVAHASDADFSRLFNAYNVRCQPGEASSSAS